MSEKWTKLEVHLALELVLAAKRPGQVRGAFVKAAQLTGHGADSRDEKGELDGDPVRRYLWGMIQKYPGQVYQGPAGPQVDRAMSKPTAGELWLLGVVVDSKSGEKGVGVEYDYAYLSGPLNRTAAWVKMVLNEIDPPRQIEGLGLPKQP